MIKDYTKWIIIFCILIPIQLVISDYLIIYQLKPDLILIGLVFLTLSFGQIPGIMFAFFSGLLFDLLSGGVVGASSLSKVISIFLCGYFYNENRIEIILRNYTFSLVVLLTSTLDGFIYLLIILSEEIPSLIFLIFQYGVFPGLYTALLSSIILIRPKKKLISS